MIGAAITVAGIASIYAYDATFAGAPSHTWPILLGAIDESMGIEREKRLAALHESWGEFDGIRRNVWIKLAKEWRVCDGLNGVDGCRMPAGTLVSQGEAREVLTHLSWGRPRYEQSHLVIDAPSAVDATKRYLQGGCDVTTPCTFKAEREGDLWRVRVEAHALPGGHLTLLFDERGNRIRQ